MKKAGIFYDFLRRGQAAQRDVDEILADHARKSNAGRPPFPKRASTRRARGGLAAPRRKAP